MREELELKLLYKKDSQTERTAAAGKLSNSRAYKFYMQLPELSSTLGVEHKVHVTKKLDRSDVEICYENLVAN
jgi:hypothetical protein